MDDLAHQLAALRPALVRYARRRMRNEAWAEDAVSETLMVALEDPEAFSGRAHLQTWLIGILKHKLIDQLRRHTREQAMEFDDEDGGDASSNWSETASMWGVDSGAAFGDPQERLARRQFMQQLEHSVRALPVRQGRAFVLREFLDVDTEDVCRELGVTANNLSVMLHRARRQLRASLQPLCMPTAPASPVHA
jgi:RNA polymerase sigma-70 factor (ECF subfamily)